VKFISKLSNCSLVCNELQVKDYKELIKCAMGDDPDVAIFVETLSSILGNVTNKSAEYIKSLCIIDILCLLIDIRYNSLGACNLVITQGEEKFNLELNLDTSKTELSVLFDAYKEKVTFNNIEVLLSVPSLQRLYEPHKEDYAPYITACIVENAKSLEICTNTQAMQVFDLLPPKLALDIIAKFNSLLQQICAIDLLQRYNILNQQLVILPTIEFLMWFTKLLFGEDLGTFYDNLFSLSYSGKMNAAYVENLPVGEYNYFIGLLRQTLAPKESSSSEVPMDNMPDISDGF